MKSSFYLYIFFLIKIVSLVTFVNIYELLYNEMNYLNILELNYSLQIQSNNDQKYKLGLALVGC